MKHFQQIFGIALLKKLFPCTLSQRGHCNIQIEKKKLQMFLNLALDLQVFNHAQKKF
jgi:hypothetical protein